MMLDHDIIFFILYNFWPYKIRCTDYHHAFALCKCSHKMQMNGCKIKFFHALFLKLIVILKTENATVHVK